MANIENSAGKPDAGLVRKGLTEALFAAVLSFGMFVLYVGLKTDQNISNELIIVQRWGLLAITRVVNPGSIFARVSSVLTTSSLFIYNCRHLSIKFWTSSISCRETFLLSLLEADADPESATGASVV
jgi:hypothetical protein